MAPTTAQPTPPTLPTLPTPPTPPTPTLLTERLRLRPFTDADADALFALQSDAHVLRYWDASPWSDHRQAERFIAACSTMAAEGSGARLAVELLPDRGFMGWCSLAR